MRDDRDDARRQRTPQPDNRVRPHLPVTAEVGSEGGSYADPTHQVASFEDDLPRTAHRTVEGRNPDPDPNHGMIRYPTDPPDSPAAVAGRPARPNWRAGAIGAIAGAVAVAGVALLRRRIGR